MDDGDHQATVATPAQTHVCPVRLVAPDGGGDSASGVPARESETLHAASSSESRDGVPRVRRFVAASPVHDWFRDVLAPGPIGAIESPSLAEAPCGTLLIEDDASGEHGQVVAERVLGGGWVLGDRAVLR